MSLCVFTKLNYYNIYFERKTKEKGKRIEKVERTTKKKENDFQIMKFFFFIFKIIFPRFPSWKLKELRRKIKVESERKNERKARKSKKLESKEKRRE